MNEDFITLLRKHLKSPQKTIIIHHKNPDGDALGSSLSLMHFLLLEKHVGHRSGQKIETSFPRTVPPHFPNARTRGKRQVADIA